MDKKIECGFGELPEELQAEFRLSPSKIKDSLESMKLYKWRLDRKMKTTKAMELGTLLHMAILEPDLFKTTYITKPRREELDADAIFETAAEMQAWLVANGQKKSGTKPELMARIKEFNDANPITKQALIFWDELIDDLAKSGKIIMSDKENEQVTETLKEIDRQPFTKWLTSNGEREKKMWFREPGTGVIVNMRVDFYSPGIGTSKIPVVMDVKKVVDVKLFKMQRWLDESKTGVQLALNRDCVKAITGIEPKCMILAIDAKEPYNVVPYTLDQAALEVSEHQYKQQIVQIQLAHAANKFSGLSDGTPINLNLPHYVLNREMLGEDEIVSDHSA